VYETYGNLRFIVTILREFNEPQGTPCIMERTGHNLVLLGQGSPGIILLRDLKLSQRGLRKLLCTCVLDGDRGNIKSYRYVVPNVSAANLRNLFAKT
jgi:hypothetical protein